MKRNKITYSLYLHAKSGYNSSKVKSDGSRGFGSRWRMESSNLEPLIKMIDRHCNPLKKRMPWEHVQILKCTPGGGDTETIMFIKVSSVYGRED